MTITHIAYLDNGTLIRLTVGIFIILYIRKYVKFYNGNRSGAINVIIKYSFFILLFIVPDSSM